MRFTIGNTKIIAGKFFLQDFGKIEINFEYLFTSYNSYRRFVNVVSDFQGKSIIINIKSKFSNSLDCDKLAQLLIGVSKIITQENILILDQILEDHAAINLDEFLALQEGLTKYFL